MIKESFKSIIGAVVTSIFIIIFIVQAFYIPSASMEPTLQVGDRILVNKFIYRFRSPQRGEVIVFKYPVKPEYKFIKRVVGLPGERVEIIDGVVYIDGKSLKEEYIIDKGYTDFSETVVPKGHYFVLGDNRNNSEDSRFWGFLPQENIVGKAFLIFWPLKRIKLIEG